ncbi:MAG: squalene/phytoene synthase family protein [Deltaproteobacteria bacterium]
MSAWLRRLDARIDTLLAPGDVGVSAAAADRRHLDDAYRQAAATTRRCYPRVYYAGLLLPRHQRRDFFVVGGWQRELDVLSEDPSPVGRALWAKFVRDTLAPVPPDDPLLIAFADVRRRRGIPRAWIEAEIEGIGGDHVAPDHRSLDDLMDYCFGVLGPAGFVMSRLLGVSDRATLRYAALFGTGVQLTDIICDIAADFEAGRVYLPKDELRSHGVDPEALAEHATSTGWRTFMASLVDHNRALFDAAAPGIARLPRMASLATATLGALNRASLDDIEASGYDVFARRPRMRAGHFVKAMGAVVRIAGATHAPRPLDARSRL